MKLFSQGPSGYMSTLKWAFVALVVVGFLRFLVGLIGVPIAAGGKVFSMTIVLLISVLLYGVVFARRGGKLGDVLASTTALVVVYTAVMAAFLSLSVGLDLSTYYNDEAHFRGTLRAHILGHLQFIPFATVIGTAMSSLVFGMTRLIGRWSGKASEART